MTDDERKLMDVTENAVTAALARPCPDPDHLLCWVCAKIKHEDEFPQCEVAGHAVCNDCLEDGDQLYKLVEMLEVELREVEKVVRAVEAAVPHWEFAVSFNTPANPMPYAIDAHRVVDAAALYRAWQRTHAATGPKVVKP